MRFRSILWLGPLFALASFTATTNYLCQRAVRAGLGRESSGHLALESYEATRILGLKAVRDLKSFRSEQGIRVTQRSATGEVLRSKVRVLSDNPTNQNRVLGEHNNWGRERYYR